MDQDSLGNDGSKTTTADDILDIINEPDDVPDKETKKDAKTETETSNKEDKKEVEEENEIELETSDDEDEDTELVDEVLNVPVSKKEILKVYPELFKKFPALESAYYQAQQFREVFPTVEDAKEAVEDAKILESVSNDLNAGDLSNVFKTVKTNNPKAFRKMADNLIKSLSTVDESVGLHVISNIMRSSLNRALTTATRTKNSDLKIAAEMINEFVFGEDEIHPPSKLVNTNDKDNDEDESNKINEKWQQIAQKEFDTAFASLDTKVKNTIKATIDANIDKKSVMTSYVKRNAIRDASEQLEKVLSSDPSFKRTIDSLWKSAKEANYSSSSLDRIRSTHLSKAKALLPRIIASARNDALKGMGRADRNNDDKDRRGPIPAHRSSSTSNTNRGKAGDIPQKMSTKDYIMSD